MGICILVCGEEYLRGSPMPLVLGVQECNAVVFANAYSDKHYHSLPIVRMRLLSNSATYLAKDPLDQAIVDVESLHRSMLWRARLHNGMKSFCDALKRYSYVAQRQRS